MRIVVSILCFTLAAVSVQASSVTASGTVFSYDGTNLKIERPDGTRVNAACTDVAPECAEADLGDVAWGRAVCSGGYCTWSCLEVLNTCNESPLFFARSGVVVGKDFCAGVLSLTVLINTGGALRAPCLGNVTAQCDAVDINDRVYTEFTVGCDDAQWEAIVPN